jgi:hypothetical protein
MQPSCRKCRRTGDEQGDHQSQDLPRGRLVGLHFSTCLTFQGDLHPPGWKKKKPRSHTATRLRSTNVESVRS